MKNLSTAYENSRPQYEAFTAILNQLFSVLLEAKGIEFFSIEPRTKTLSSFDEKIHRDDKNDKYECIEDITDLTGVRIIAYLEEDCDRVCRMIEDNFDVDLENSSKKEDDLDADKFGYLSTHYVISLGKGRTSLPEFSRFQGLKAEVQVRTLLQHTWAAIDWKFRYKTSEEAPKQLRRRLFRISALLEAADNEFSAVNTQIKALRKQYTQEITSGKLEIGINTESLFSFLETSEEAIKIISAAETAGISAVHDAPAQSNERLVKTLDVLNIKTLQDLENRLKVLTPKALEFFSGIYEYIPENKSAGRKQLITSAIIRYILYAFTNASKRREISSAAPLSPGYAAAIAKVRP